MADITNIILWFFLPRFLQKVLYVFIRSPPAGSKLRERIFITVISLYLCGTLYDAYRNLPTNYYTSLNVATNATAANLKASFRQVTLTYHPDKNPSEEAAHIFMSLRQMYETLTDSTRRDAYDRFG